jgi:hypothetical protein
VFDTNILANKRARQLDRNMEWYQLMFFSVLIPCRIDVYSEVSEKIASSIFRVADYIRAVNVSVATLKMKVAFSSESSELAILPSEHQTS